MPPLPFLLKKQIMKPSPSPNCTPNPGASTPRCRRGKIARLPKNLRDLARSCSPMPPPARSSFSVSIADFSAAPFRPSCSFRVFLSAPYDLQFEPHAKFTPSSNPLHLRSSLVKLESNLVKLGKTKNAYTHQQTIANCLLINALHTSIVQNPDIRPSPAYNA